MRAKTSEKDALFLFTFNVPLTEFTSVLLVTILHEYKSLNYKKLSRWDREMLQYTVIAGLIQFALFLVQIFDFAIGKSPFITAFSLLYGLCNTGVAAISPTLCHTLILLFDGKILNLNSLIQRILFYCSIVQSLCALTNWSFLTFFFFVNSGFWQQFCHIGQLHRVFSSQWMFFTILVQLCRDVWSS